MASREAPNSQPRFLPAGECAVVIELGNAIDPELNARVLDLDRALLETPFSGYLEAVPSYRSLLVFLDPSKASIETVREHVLTIGAGTRRETRSRPKLKKVPTVYDGEDLDEVARLIGAPREEVVGLHSGRDYLVYMVGFTPGFAYMGMTDDRLRLPRRATPRTRVPAGSVAIAMGQTGIYPSSTPGGWHLLGRAEHRILFDLDRDPPSYFLPGDRVRFVPVAELGAHERPKAAESRTSSPALQVEDGGLLTTVQDLGRFGYQRFGVPVAGAVDAPSLRAANALVGNPAGAAALECTVHGPSLRALRPVIVAIGGADLGAVVERSDLGRWRVPLHTSFLLRRGNRLTFEGRRSGARAYIAFAGGIDVPVVLGSRSTYLTAGFGGVEGRGLRAGDRLGLGAADPSVQAGRHGPTVDVAERDLPATIRIVLGPQEDHFTEAALETLATESFTVAASSDRMGYRLEGPLITHSGPKEIVSDGMMLGGVQVPPDGRPIVMLADRATMGGYPKIATVILADIARLGQLLPGESLRFQPVSLEDARRACAGSL